MKTRIFNKTPILLILLIALVFAKLHANKRSEGKDICFNICGDSRGYYAWLPAIFIYHDLNFKFFDEVEMKDTTCGSTTAKAIPIQDYRYYFNGKACNKYYPGTSFMVLPFFVAAHLATTYLSHYSPNGYTYYYFTIMALAAIFYYILGMFFFLGILDKLRLNTLQKSFTILLVTFGSNMIYYIIDAPLYSHIYSFTLIAAFLYYIFALNEDYSTKNLLRISFITGLILVTRPVNITILLVVPFILGSKVKLLWGHFLKKPVNFIFLLPVIVIPLILCVLYKISTGQYFLYSYAKEGFDFLHPHFWQFLFHYDNGVFSYMPLLLMPFLFLFAWYKPEFKQLITGVFITMVVTFYIHSSWWSWSYGLSFGARTILDFVPLFGILIGLSLKQTNTKKYLYLLPIYFLCCGFTMVLYNQKSAHHFMATYPITDYWDAVYYALGIK